MAVNPLSPARIGVATAVWTPPSASRLSAVSLMATLMLLGARGAIATDLRTESGRSPVPAIQPTMLISQAAPAVTLRRGDSGDAVSALQRRLTTLGYYSGPVSGFFGELTETAVMAFQRAQGLTPDGVVGASTTNALRTTASSSSSSSSSLTSGSSGEAVTNLQTRLQALGYYDGPITGFYGSMTEEAVKRFQAANGLTVDGVAGPSTLSALQRSGQSSAESGPDPNDGLLEEGETGAEVAEVQRRLKDLNYYNGSVDGDFGSLTADAVVRFQRSQGLTPDGVVGPATLAALRRVETPASPAPSATAPAPTPAPPPASTTPFPNPSQGVVTTPPPTAAPEAALPPVAPAPMPTMPAPMPSAPMPSAPAVAQPTGGQASIMELQRKLQNEGFYNGPIDGIMSPETQRAIDAARSSYGVNSSDFSGGNPF